ncbi:MAG: hypothetical protein ABIT37_05735 [Luteolibacter sp.]
MKRSNLIFTHASVFAVGIAVAVIATKVGDSSSDPQSASGESNARSARSGSLERSIAEDATGHRSGNTEARSSSKRDAKQPVEHLADIVRMTDPSERQRALMDLVDKLGPGEFAAVADKFRELDHLGDSGGEYELILRGWAKADPLTALEYVGQFPNSRGGRSTILSTWAGQDGTAAEKWALDHHEGDGPNPYMAAVIRGLAGTDLTEASRLAQAMPQSRERAEAVDSITRALFLQGVDAAMAYPASIKDDALRGGFVSAIADRMIAKDPAKAAAWIAAMPDGAIQNRAAHNVAEALAQADTAKATAWVATLKPEAQVEAARGVIPIMSSADIAGTAKWVSSLAGTPGYDRAVEEFVWSCDNRAPEQAAAWIAGVSNPDQQRRLYYRMLGEWAQRDAVAVKQWVAANNVPQDIARRFLR